MSEANEQTYVFSWRAWNIRKIPELKFLHSSLNGVRLTSKLLRFKMFQQGMTKGVLDIFWPLKRTPYSGLYIEMKFGKNTLSKEQKEFKEFVISQGYKVVVCYTGVEAVEEIEAYYKKKINELKKGVDRC